MMCVECNSTVLSFFFFNDTATTEIYTLSLHDALPISRPPTPPVPAESSPATLPSSSSKSPAGSSTPSTRSEEHTSELQSRQYLVCRLLLVKKKKTTLEQ